MTIGLVGRKCGMTRVFTDAGESVPVTVVEVLANRVTQVKDDAADGYRAVQVTYGKRRPQLLGKALTGHYAKAKVEPGRSAGRVPPARRAKPPTCSRALNSTRRSSRPASWSMSPAPPSARALPAR